MALGEIGFGRKGKVKSGAKSRQKLKVGQKLSKSWAKAGQKLDKSLVKFGRKKKEIANLNTFCVTSLVAFLGSLLQTFPNTSFVFSLRYLHSISKKKKTVSGNKNFRREERELAERSKKPNTEEEKRSCGKERAKKKAESTYRCALLKSFALTLLPGLLHLVSQPRLVVLLQQGHRLVLLLVEGPSGLDHQLLDFGLVLRLFGGYGVGDGNGDAALELNADVFLNRS
jgi:hypothetical protein